MPLTSQRQIIEIATMNDKQSTVGDEKTNIMETEKNSQDPKNSLMERMARFWNNATEESDSDDNASDGKTLSLTLALSAEENARICSAELNQNNSISIKIRLGSKKQNDQAEE